MKLVYIIVAAVGAFVVYTMLQNQQRSRSNIIAGGATTYNPTQGSQAEAPGDTFSKIAAGIAGIINAGSNAYVAGTSNERN